MMREKIVMGLELCEISCFVFRVLNRSSRFDNLVWINDSEDKVILFLFLMLINPNKIVSLTHWHAVCGLDWGEITAQKPLICEVGTLHHPAWATPEVAEPASADAFH